MSAKSEENKKLAAEIEKKHGKSIAELISEREQRVKDAIDLKQPDRVPVTVNMGVFACHYAGLPASAMYYDHAAYQEACKKTLIEIEPDNTMVLAARNAGTVMELIDDHQYKWPGFNLPEDTSFQFVEDEYMKEDEYDLFLEDPSDFVLRYYLPRVYGLLAPLPKLPPLRTAIFGQGFQPLIPMLASPEYQKIGQTIMKAEAELARMRKEGGAFAAEMAELGFPSQGPGGRSITFVPFDVISDRLRGMRGIMLDMYRRPEKLLEACDRVTKWWKEECTPAEPDPRGNHRRAGMPLHRGSDGFMSDAQFDKFYWPQLKDCIEFNISLGYISAPFWEGIWDSRLEYLLELPKGKVIFFCENTNIFKAKEVLGGHMCIQGGVPPSILQYGTPEEVDAHCRKLIEVVGKDGGFIMGAGSSIDYARPENIKAMVDAAKKYSP